MEWLDGRSFEKCLKAGSSFTVTEGVTICEDLLDGIEHLHSRQICHLDMHAGNLMVLTTGRAKIIDVDANKNISLEKLSNYSQQSNKQQDVEYCSGIISSVFRLSGVDLNSLPQLAENLRTAATIEDLRNVVLSIPVGYPSTSIRLDWLFEVAAVDISSDRVIELLDTRVYFELLKIPHPSSIGEVIDHLALNKLVVKGATTCSVLNIGAILLAKKLVDFDASLSRKSIRFVLYDGTGKLTTKNDIVGGKGYAVGFEGLVDYVHSIAPKNIFFEGGVRKRCFPGKRSASSSRMQ